MGDACGRKTWQSLWESLRLRLRRRRGSCWVLGAEYSCSGRRQDWNNGILK